MMKSNAFHPLASPLANAMAAARAKAPLHPSVVNVSVRLDDARAFRAVIAEREAMIERGQFEGLAKRERERAMIDQIAGRALDALVEIKSTNPDRERVAANLQSCAATAIAALSKLKTEGGAK